MTSIFHSSFVENLQRIQGSRGEPVAKPKGESAGQFAEVLADVERKAKNGGGDRISNSDSGLRAELTRVATPTPPPVTELLVSPDHPLFALPPRHVEPEACLVSECLGGVKADVKVPAVLDEGEVPSAPVIKSAERITLSIPGGSREPIHYSRSEIETIINTAGRFHGVDPDLSKAVAQAESSFRPDAVSKDGFSSKGIFQLLDSTAADLIGRFDVQDQYDPFDPALNAYLGVGYLRRLHDLFGESSNLGGNLKTYPAKSGADLEKISLAAFNAGEGNVARAQERAKNLGKDPASFDAIEEFLPPSTRTYVSRVLDYRTQYARSKDGSNVA